MLIDFRELFPKYNIKPKGVLHVGANIGEEAPVYLELGIKKQIWIEANPEIYEKLKVNISGNPEAIALNWCVSDIQDERVNFNISNNGSQSSSILELGTHLQVHPEVKYIGKITMSSVILEKLYLGYGLNEFHAYGTHFKHMNFSTDYTSWINDIDFLNIDLQGAELKALRGLGQRLNNFKWAYLEVNKEELYKGCALVGEIDEYLLGFGFRRVETLWCGNTGWGDALYVKD